MSKLFKLKEWLTLSEAAKHLSIAFGEDISEADILRLALDEQLKLSINMINGTSAECGKVVPLMQALAFIAPSDWNNATLSELLDSISHKVRLQDELPENIKKGLQDHTLYFRFLGTIVGENEILEFDHSNSEHNHAITLRGIFDIPMIGGGRLDIEHKYQMLTGGVEVTDVNIDGTFVTKPDGTWFRLLTRYDNKPYSNLVDANQEQLKRSFCDFHKWNELSNYYPAGILPLDDAVLVVRTEALRDFEQTLNAESKTKVEKPIATTERNTLLTIIAALCGYSKIVTTRPIKNSSKNT